MHNTLVGTRDPINERYDTSIAVFKHIFFVQRWRGNQLSELISCLDLKIGRATAALCGRLHTFGIQM